jgi:hypothetical protein
MHPWRGGFSLLAHRRLSDRERAQVRPTSFDAPGAMQSRNNDQTFMPRSLSAGYPVELSASADRRNSTWLLHSYVKFGQVVARKIVPPRKRSVRCGLFQCKSKGI